MNLNTRFIKNNRNIADVAGQGARQARGEALMMNLARTKEDKRH